MSFSKVFHIQFPLYLAMGMSYSEYWEMDCSLVEDYRQADLLKQQKVSNDAWLQGMYFYNAIGCVLSNAFSEKGSNPAKYAEKPLRVIPKTKEEKEREAEEEKQRLINFLQSLKADFDAKQKRKQDDG